MFGLGTCRVEEKLLRELDDSILNVKLVKDHPAPSPVEAHERLIAARAAWIEHRVECVICKAYFSV